MVNQYTTHSHRQRVRSPDDVSSPIGEVDLVDGLRETCSQYHPQYDPREEESTDESETGDLSPDDDEDRRDSYQEQIEEEYMDVPVLFENVRDWALIRPLRPHERYTGFLHRLCVATATAKQEVDCLQCFPEMICELDTFDLHESLASEPQADLFAYALIIYLWLLILKKRMHGNTPEKYEYLHRQWASYYLSASEVLESDGTNIKGLVGAMCYWEDRGYEKMHTLFRSRSHWLRVVGQENPDVACYRNEEAQTYLDTLQDSHVEGLTKQLIHREVQLQQSAMKELPNVESSKGILVMLLSMDPDILKAIIEGQIARKAEIPCSSVYNCLDRLENVDVSPPAIYENAICDWEGNSPTPFQWFAILELMQIYVSVGEQGDKLAADVDQIIHPNKYFPIPATKDERLFRRYTDYDSRTGKKRYEPCSLRRDIVLQFLGELTGRLNRENEQQRLHTPLVAPVVEIGFSNNVKRRLRDHRMHRCSNYLMNLAQALFEYRYPGQFCLKQHVIYHCWLDDQPWASEIFLTRLSQGYISNGGGFSHHGPGSSNGGAWRRRAAREWAKFELTTHSDREFQARLKAVSTRAVARAEEDKAKAAEATWKQQYFQALGDVLDAIHEAENARHRFMTDQE